MPTKNSLRTLAKQIDDLTRGHPAYSQVWGIVSVLTGYLTALARVNELAHDEAKAHQVLKFYYTNYKGEFAQRCVRPLTVRWGTSDFYPDPGWLLSCWDLDKNDIREFSMARMSCVQQQDRPQLELPKVDQEPLRKLKEFSDRRLHHTQQEGRHDNDCEQDEGA